MAIDVKLEEIIAIKQAIKQAIIAKGVYVSDGDSFLTYATRIGQISTPTINFEIVNPLDNYIEDYGYLCDFAHLERAEDAFAWDFLSTQTYYGVTLPFKMGIKQGNNLVVLNSHFEAIGLADLNVGDYPRQLVAQSSDGNYSVKIRYCNDDEQGESFLYFESITGFATEGGN